MGAGASSVPAIKDALKDVSDAQISGIISKLSAETRTKMLLALEATDDIASATLVPLEKLPESFSDIEGTRFAEVLRRGHMAVIKASYFKECLEKGEPFQDRSNIPAEYIYTGEEVLENWKKYGNMFLMILSYSWLSKKHPDPDLYHLKRLVPLLDKMRVLYSGEDTSMFNIILLPGPKIPDFGIIVDFCSLWQNLSENEGEDSRTEEQKTEFDAGLKTINTPYVHQETTAIKLIGTPEDELRTYDLRGWTLFESRVIDGKGTGTIPKAMGWRGKNVSTLGFGNGIDEVDFGSMNVLVVHEKIFPPHHDPSLFACAEYVSELLGFCAQRSVPCKPDRFRGELEERRCSAEIKGQRLFTSGKDQPFVQDLWCAPGAEISGIRICLIVMFDTCLKKVRLVI